MTAKGVDLAPQNIDMIGGVSIAGAVAGNVLVFDSNLDLVPGAGGADHMAVTVSNASNAVVTLSVSSNQVLSAAFVASNAEISHTNLTASNINADTNNQHISSTGLASLVPRVATVVAMKALSGTSNSVVYCQEKAGLYNYCVDCAYVTDDDLLTITGDGGNTRWELMQKISRTQGDTGWINTDNATLTAISATEMRLTISTAAAIAIKSVRIAVPIGNYDATITGVAGVKFVGFNDATLVLSVQDSLWDFNTQVPVAVVYWSGTAIVAAPQTEFHGIRDAVWHHWAHSFLGTQYVSGLSFTGSVQTDNNTNPGATNEAVQNLWSTAGKIQDEDFVSSPGSGQWLQTLGSGLTSSNAGVFNHFYFNGTFITTAAAMADRAPFIHAGVDTPPQWNSGGTLTSGITGDYVVYHYFATPMVGGWSVFGRPHNAVFRSLASAQTARPSQLTWTNYAELKHLYTAIFRVNTGWDNSHRCKLVRLDDYRLTAGTPVAAVAPTAHANLSGLELSGADITYGHISDQAQIIEGAKTFSSHLLSTDADTPAGNELIPVAKLGPIIAAATAKTTPVDADSVGLSDSADSGILKKLTWANLKATLISTAMTWTGKQTFDGGAAIKGIATAPTAGYVGEVVSAAITDTSAATSDTAVTLANGLVLGIGRWEIFYATLANYTTGSSLNDRGQVRVWVYDNDVGIATVVGKTLSSVSCRTVAATGNDMQATISSCCVVDVATGTKDYRLGCKRIDAAGTGSATVYGGDFGNFYAIRRA